MVNFIGILDGAVTFKQRKRPPMKNGGGVSSLILIGQVSDWDSADSKSRTDPQPVS
jgi:hypothetical protein